MTTARRGSFDGDDYFMGVASLAKNKHSYVCHAEMIAICNKNSADVKDSTMYVTLFPCNECAKLIVENGIKEVVYQSYKDKPSTDASKLIFDAAGVKYR
ncbi:deoxycytidylate deaminase-like isoform X3 [Agrilus planipennis]|uniref:dCMP deaminase n=1 Tax=Agrilus planipennis TaxID=224129 RepID=A0A1W4XMR3_AGRPL|nr:deoxycytidylate deaminase-like isoform X3 [Agrilus planipennis]